jgi:hypothetical protein
VVVVVLARQAQIKAATQEAMGAMVCKITSLAQAFITQEVVADRAIKAAEAMGPGGLVAAAMREQALIQTVPVKMAPMDLVAVEVVPAAFPRHFSQVATAAPASLS